MMFAPLLSCSTSLCLFLAVLLTSTVHPIKSNNGDISRSMKHRLLYFNARGAAEVSRIMFRVGGLDFEDHRYAVTPKDGGGFETVEFSSLKESGAFTSNMDRVPVLEIDGNQRFGQSRAIERYIAEKCGLIGDSAEDKLCIDSIAENVRDIKDRWGKIRMMGGFGTNPEKEKAIAKWFKEGEYADWLVKLEKSLPANAVEDLALGRSVSYADISIWHLLRDYFSAADLDAARSAEKNAGCSRLTKIADRVAQMSTVKKWLTERPSTVF